jgi:hypothetical protein
MPHLTFQRSTPDSPLLEISSKSSAFFIHNLIIQWKHMVHDEGLPDWRQSGHEAGHIAHVLWMSLLIIAIASQSGEEINHDPTLPH